MSGARIPSEFEDDAIGLATDPANTNSAIDDDLGELANSLTPRARKKPFIALGLVVLAIGFVLVRGLKSSVSYFLRADEAIARMNTLGEKRFRLQGFVADGSVVNADKLVTFDVEVNGAVVHVTFPKTPPELFRNNIPVVIVGQFAPNQLKRPAGTKPLFLGDEIQIKHDENYIEKNKDRMAGAVDDPNASTPSTEPTSEPTSELTSELASEEAAPK
jgi:cytochrome c-type biogenesis protein CcmE